MSNEIKAILIQNGEPTPGNPIEIKRLLVNKEAEDYITNLQEENERLKYDLKNLIKLIEKNCCAIEGTDEEFESLDRCNKLIYGDKNGN